MKVFCPGTQARVTDRPGSERTTLGSSVRLAAAAAAPPRRSTALSAKRKVLGLQERVTVLKWLKGGRSCRAIAAELDCGKTQISRIKMDKEAIMAEWNAGTRLDLKYVKRRKTVYEDLNNLVWAWFATARSKKQQVSGRAIQVRSHATPSG